MKLHIILGLLILGVLISGCTQQQEKSVNVSTSDEGLNKTPSAEKESAKICVDVCGDGECQEVVCTGEGCPCAETVNSCPKDCPQKVEVVKGTYINVSAAEAKEMIENNPDLVIIDVSQNYAQGHIPKAVNYPSGIPDLDKEGKYLVYCHTDAASIEAANLLVDAGFKNVYRLEGNYESWVDAGYEVEPKPANETAIMENETEIVPEKVPTAAGIITNDELANHNNRHDCWVAYDGKVYDVTLLLVGTSASPRCGAVYGFDTSAETQHYESEIPTKGVFKGMLETTA